MRGMCRVAAAPYPAYKMWWYVPDGGCALPGLQGLVVCAGWRLRFIRPTRCGGMCRMVATPYPAYE